MIADSYEDFDSNVLDDTYTTDVLKIKPPTKFLQDRYKGATPKEGDYHVRLASLPHTIRDQYLGLAF